MSDQYIINLSIFVFIIGSILLSASALAYMVLGMFDIFYYERYLIIGVDLSVAIMLISVIVYLLLPLSYLLELL